MNKRNEERDNIVIGPYGMWCHTFFTAQVIYNARLYYYVTSTIYFLLEILTDCKVNDDDDNACCGLILNFLFPLHYHSNLMIS